MKAAFTKYVTAGMLIAVLATGGLSVASAAGTSTDEQRFPPVGEYIPYEDVSENDWFFEYVKLCQETGIMTGVENNCFDTRGYVSKLAAVTIASRLHQVYHDLPPIDPRTDYDFTWFNPYYDYALEHGIIDSQFDAGSGELTDRSEFVTYIMRALPEEEFPAINIITSIPDLNWEDVGAEDIFLLCNAGILAGTDVYGTFGGSHYITRPEVAAILCRVIRHETRIEFEPAVPDAPKLTALPFLNDDLIYITDFDGTLIYVRSSEQVAAFDLQGNLVVPWQAGRIFPAGEGIARVERGYDDESGNHRTVYYNSAGALLTSTEYFAGTSFCQGLAAVQESSAGPISILDTSGEIVGSFANEGQQLISGAPSDGRLVLDGVPTTEGKVTVLDLSTRTLTTTPYAYMHPFSDGRARATKGLFDPWCYLDANLEEVIPPDYEYTDDFSNGLAIVGNGENAFGAIDPSGNVAVPLQYNFYGAFNQAGMAIAEMLVDDVWQSCVIDVSGQIIGTLPSAGNVYYQLYDWVILAQSNISYYSLLDETGRDILSGMQLENALISPAHSAIIQTQEGYFLFVE